MNNPPTAHEIEALVEGLQFSISALCREVGVDPSTFWRWKAGTNAPSVETVRKMVKAIQKRQRAA